MLMCLIHLLPLPSPSLELYLCIYLFAKRISRVLAFCTHCVPIMLIEQQEEAKEGPVERRGSRGWRVDGSQQVYRRSACSETPNRPEDCAHKNFTRSETEKYVNARAAKGGRVGGGAVKGGSNIFNKVHVLAKLLSLTKMLAVLHIIRSTFNLP